MKTYLRFPELKARRIINDRTALTRAIDRYGFPAPIALGSNTLAWAEARWLACSRASTYTFG